jgi:hypothetical protein
LGDRLFHNRQRSKASNKKRGSTSTDYVVAFVGAMCVQQYAMTRRPKGNFHFGLVSHIPRHRLAA